MLQTKRSHGRYRFFNGVSLNDSLSDENVRKFHRRVFFRLMGSGVEVVGFTILYVSLVHASSICVLKYQDTERQIDYNVPC